MIAPGRLANRLTDTARRAAARAARTRLGQRVRRPAVSVVVPFYNVEDYFAECLDSIAGQTSTDFEVVLVDDGSPDDSRAIAERYVARDPRFRLVVRENGGLGAARNTGIRHARGRFLTFVDSDDVLPPAALATLRTSARRTGSDIVVGNVARFDSYEEWRPSWARNVHTVRRERVRLEQFLPVLRNLYTWNKLFRRDFWDAQGLWFREGVAYEDQPIITQLLLAARSIDVLPDVVYRYRERDDRSSISQQKDSLTDLQARVRAWRETETALAEAPAAVRDGWFRTLLTAHFIWYLAGAGTADDGYWELIQSTVADIAGDIGASVWASVAPWNRVVVELARQGRREDLRALVEQWPEPDVDVPTRVTDDGVVVELPGHDDPTLDPSLFVLHPEQLQVPHMVEAVTWTPQGLELRGRAYIRGVDLAAHTSHVDLVLAGPTGREIAAEDGVDAVSGCPVTDSWCDYSRGTFRAVIPVDDLSEDRQDSREWDLRIRVSAAGFVVEAPLTDFLRAGSPGEMEPAWLADGTRVRVDWGHHRAARLVVEPPGARAGGLHIDGRRVSGSVTGPADRHPGTIDLVSGTRVVRTRADARPDGTRFDAVIPAGTATWDLRAWPPGSRSPCPVELPDIDAAIDGTTAAAEVSFARTPEGFARIEDRGPAAWAEHVESLGGEGVRVTGRLVAPGVTSLRLRTTSVKDRSAGPSTPVVDGRFEATLDLRRDVFRFGRLPLGIGEHGLVAELAYADAPGVEVPVVIAPGLRRLLPLPYDNAVQKGMFVRGATGALQLNLARPAATPSSLRRPPSPPPKARTRGLLLRSYFGERATDSGVAIQAELRRRGSDLPVYWALQDHSTPVPEGATPVIVNSPEWYELLGSATYYVDNMYQPDYHHKPDGQVVVETFHGYPFKQMGHPHWRHQGFPRALVESYDRRAAEWDYLVSPAPYATPLLTRDFAYDGPVLEIGYPRNDVLLSAGADDLRATVRESLGIEPGRTAVLYAPTFRDYLARDNNEARMSDFMDFAAVRRAFGDEVVVLMRGHAFNARTAQRVGALPGVIDVTDYPEINDLYLAADVAVVDYSSLRFDFAVTGKPMIFLVPDIERYVEARGWLMDFGPTAPGPQVSTTDEVIEQLTDIPGLVGAHRDAYAEFRSAYIPLEDGHAAARFVDAVMAPRGDA